MKKFTMLMLGLAFIGGTVALADDAAKDTTKTTTKTKATKAKATKAKPTTAKPTTDTTKKATS